VTYAELSRRDGSCCGGGNNLIRLRPLRDEVIAAKASSSVRTRLLLWSSSATVGECGCDGLTAELTPIESRPFEEDEEEDTAVGVVAATTSENRVTTAVAVLLPLLSEAAHISGLSLRLLFGEVENDDSGTGGGVCGTGEGEYSTAEEGLETSDAS